MDAHTFLRHLAVSFTTSLADNGSLNDEEPPMEGRRIGDRDPGSPSAWFYTICFMMLFFIVICFGLMARDGLPSFCTRFLPHYSRHPVANIPQTSEEFKQQQIEKQRAERRLWYSIYLKPYLTVLTAEHFITDDAKECGDDRHELEETPETAQASSDDNKGDDNITKADSSKMPDVEAVPIEDCPSEQRDEKTEDAVDADNLHEPSAENDIESGKPVDDTSADNKPANDLVCLPVGSPMPEDEEAPMKWMTIWDQHDTCFRKVEANCCICMLDYEEGDTIVRSAAKEEEEYCIHVFHLDCMLQWLSQGKKRCPFCRHWFVPAIPIKEQMKEAHVVTRDESLHHLYDARTMQDVTSLSGETDSNYTHSFNSDDDIELGRQQSSESVTGAATIHQAGVRSNTSHPSHGYRSSPHRNHYLADRSARYAQRTAHVARAAGRVYSA